MAATIQDVIQQELEKNTSTDDFVGFQLTDDNSNVRNWVPNLRRDEFLFFLPLKYQDVDVYYIPKSYLEKGYYNPEKNQWYGSPILLNKQTQEYLKPAKINEDVLKELKSSYAYGGTTLYTDDTKTSTYLSEPLWTKVPNLEEGYIIERSAINDLQNEIKHYQGGDNYSLVWRWNEPLRVPTGMSMKDGQLVYMGYDQGKRDFYAFWVNPNGEGRYQWYEAGRSLFGSFFDSIGLEDVGDFIEGPIFSTLLILTGNPTAVAAGLGLQAGNAIRNENWGQLALTLIAANTPSSNGKALAAGTIFEIPAIANATATISTTLGVSAQTAGLIMQGTVEFLASGFDLESALKATAAHYVGQQVGGKVGDLLRTEGFKNLATLTQNVTSASTKALLLNKPVDEAARTAFVQTAVPMTLRSVPNVDKLTAGQYAALENALITKGVNPNVDLQDLLKGAITDVVTYDIINKSDEFKNLPENIQKIAFDSMRNLVQGQDVNTVFANALTKTVYAQIENQIKDVQAQNEGWDNYEQKIGAQKTFGKQYKTEITPYMYQQLLQDLRDTTFNADTNDKIATVNEARDAAILGGYNTFIFDKKIYTIGGYALDAADELYRTQGEEFIFRGGTGNNEQRKVQAYKAGFNTIFLDAGWDIDPVTGEWKWRASRVASITPEEQKRIQQQIDFPGIFDGSKYKDVNEAAKAAATVNEGKFLWNGNVYQVKAPETALNQIKNASTFNEAFALAQKNLGEGNVFEWDGKLYVNRTGAQAAALPFNGNKYEDRGAAAYAAHMAGKDVFTWGGNTWKLPSDYSSQISRALGQNPDQSAAETKRLLDANIQAAPGNILSPDKIRLDQTGVPILDQMIGTYAWIQGRGISAVANQIQLFADGKSILSDETIDTNRFLKMAEEFGQKLQYEDVTKEIERQTNVYFPGLRELAKEPDALKQAAGFARLTLDNPLAWVGLLVDESAQEALPLAVGLGVGSVTTAGLTALKVPPHLAAAAGLNVASLTSAVLNGFESFAASAKEEIESGTDRATALLVGGANAAITVATEFVGDKVILAPWMKDAVNKGVGEVVKNVLVKPTAVNVVTEGIETFSQGVTTRAIKGEPQNYAEDRVKSMLAMSLAAGVSIQLTTPALINGAAQIALDNYGRPVTFDEFMGRDGGGGRSIDLSTLNLNTPLLTLNDGSQLTIGGMQLLLPGEGIDRSFINEFTPELRLSRNDDAIFTRQQTFDDAGRFIGYSYAPVKLKDSKPVFERYLIDIGDIPTITEAEAKNLLQLEGRKNPTETEIQQVVDKARDENDRDIAKQIADPFTVSIEEVKEAARAAGYAITDEEAAKYVEERLETEALTELAQKFDPLATTEQEVREMFEAQGYSPTQEEIDRFVQSIPEAQIKGQLQTYVDPRMLYPSDVKALAAQEGYEISDARARELSGQKDKYASLDALRAEFDAGAVTLDEARQMFANTPYKPTDEEIARFIGSKSESQIQQDINNYVAPRYVTIQDVKDAAAAEGFTITDEQAELLSGQKDKLAAITKFRQDIDPQAVTEAEARAFFNELGYTPTTDELKNFIASRSEQQIKADISAYVDPRFVTLDEVKKVAAEEGYAISDEEAQSLTGQKSQQEVLDALRIKADAGAVLESEAADFFRQLGYEPTPEELQQFIQSKSEQQTRADIAAYVDPRFVTAQEVKDAARAEGYDITDEEAAAIAGQKNQEETITAFRKDINPQAVTEAEARAFFNELGYKPTQEELMQFVQSRSEAQVMADISAYVDPRYVTLEEVKKVANEEGYAITDEEALSLTGQKSQQEILDALRTRADTLAVLGPEARQFFADLNYTPTEEEVTQFIGSRPEADIQAELAAYVDPRYLELQEIKDAARAEGFDITDEQAAALVGQKSEEEALAEFRGEIDPQAVIEAEALAFFNEFGYSPNPEELSQFIVSRPEDQVRTDIQTYIDPRQVTREEAEARFRETESGYQFTPEEIDQFIRAGIDVDQAGVLDEIAAYIDPRYVTPEEVKSRYAELGLTTPLEQDISRFAGQKDQAATQEEIQQYLPTAQYNYTAKQLADLQAEQARQKQIEDLNTKFTQDIQALLNADPYIDIQTAIDQTIGKIDDPEQRKLIDPTAPPIISLTQEHATKKAERQQKAQQLRQQGVQMLEGFGGVPPTGPQVTSEPHKMDLETLYTGDPGDAFVSPLAPYLAKVEQQSYTGEQQPEQPLAEQKDLTDMKRREQGYFTYGQPSEIDQNLAAAADPFGFYTAAAMAGGMRAGGLVPPLMAAGGTTRYGKYAGGGLNLVPHTGKMRVDFRQGDAVTGEGDGQSDDIPAMLADGEFVIPADVVAALGNGSTKAGSDKLYDMMHSIRAEHRSADPKSLPPPAKSPLDYISKRPRAKKRR